jgi:hypothetical protein
VSEELDDSPQDADRLAAAFRTRPSGMMEKLATSRPVTMTPALLGAVPALAEAAENHLGFPGNRPVDRVIARERSAS